MAGSKHGSSRRTCPRGATSRLRRDWTSGDQRKPPDPNGRQRASKSYSGILPSLPTALLDQSSRLAIFQQLTVAAMAAPAACQRSSPLFQLARRQNELTGRSVSDTILRCRLFDPEHTSEVDLPLPPRRSPLRPVGNPEPGPRRSPSDIREPVCPAPRNLRPDIPPRQGHVPRQPRISPTWNPYALPSGHSPPPARTASPAPPTSRGCHCSLLPSR